MPAKAYNLANVICTIGSVALGGYGTDSEDSIGMEWSSALFTAKVTADGKYVYSTTNDRGCTVTIKLSRKSLVIPALFAMIEAQTGDNIGIAPPIILPLPFLLIDPSTLDQWLSVDTVFMTRPAPTYGKEAGDIELTVHLQSPKYTLGAGNLLTP